MPFMLLHPIIQAYADTEDLLDVILEKHYNPAQYLETVFLELVQYIKKREINQELILKIDQAILKGHPDLDVYLLFLITAIDYFRVLKQIEKAKSIYAIGNDSICDKAHIFIRADWLSILGYFKAGESYFNEAVELLAESLSLIDKKHQRYKMYLIDFARILAINGSLNDLNKLDAKILNSFRNEKHGYVYVEMKLVNCFIIGNYKEGYDLIEEHQRNFPGRRVKDIEMAVTELNIISGNFKESYYQEAPYSILVKAFNCLLCSKLLEAEKYCKWLLENEWNSFKVWHLVDYLPFQIELCKGNKGMVRLLLNEKKEKGKSHYLDDLFYGRLHLLENNIEKADESFALLWGNITRYGAMNRLVFELQFAREMRFSDILLLTQGWKKDRKSLPLSIKIEPINSKKLISKGLDLLIGNSPEITQVKELVKKFAPLKAPVLITGETGTGKELVSRAIHDEGSYPLEPFLAINCGALTETLLQSELFGYVAGAFTGAQKERQGIFEAAGKGTVFLDEFGDISPLLQVSLLRLLESNEIRMIGGSVNRQIECRIIIATNVELQKAVSEKKFREDLYFRLTRFEIQLPTLRERPDDLPLLIDYFLNRDKEYSEKPKKIAPELLDALISYRWPGNIRELKNEIERLKILHFEKEILNKEDFDFHHLQGYLPKESRSKTNSLDFIASDDQQLQANIRHPQEINIASENIINIVQRGSKVERRIALIRELFKKYKILTRSKIVEITHVNPSTATKELQMLCEKGFIKRQTPTSSPSTYYFELVE